RRPTVPELDGATERACRPAADPDGHVRLHPARVDHEAVERIMRAGVRRLCAPEGRPERAQCVVGTLAAVAERRAEEVELLAQRPDPDTEHQPAAGDDVEGPVPLRDRERVVVPEYEHERDEADAVRVRGEIPEDGKRIL